MALDRKLYQSRWLGITDHSGADGRCLGCRTGHRCGGSRRSRIAALCNADGGSGPFDIPSDSPADKASIKSEFLLPSCGADGSDRERRCRTSWILFTQAEFGLDLEASAVLAPNRRPFDEEMCEVDLPS